jgi:hypothetical protein
MIIVFDPTGKRITDHGTNSAFPEGVPYEPKDGENIYRINDNDPMVAEIMAAANVEGVLKNGAVDSLKIYKQIYVDVDKPEITANGIDAATITAQIEDNLSTETIEFLDGAGNIIQKVTCIGGRAQFPVMATVPGEIVIVARSTTKYGQNSVTIKAV